MGQLELEVMYYHVSNEHIIKSSYSFPSHSLNYENETKTPHNSPKTEENYKKSEFGKGNYLRVRQNVIIVMTETTGAANKLSKNSVTKSIPSPAIWVSSFNLLGLIPTLLLHTMRKAPGIVVGN